MGSILRLPWCPDSEIRLIKFRVAAGHKLLILVACSSQKFEGEFLGPDTSANAGPKAPLRRLDGVYHGG